MEAIVDADQVRSSVEDVSTEHQVGRIDAINSRIKCEGKESQEFVLLVHLHVSDSLEKRAKGFLNANTQEGEDIWERRVSFTLSRC
jgi:hypothetical protein